MMSLTIGEIKNITLPFETFVQACYMFYEHDPFCSGMGLTFWWDSSTLSPCYSYNYEPPDEIKVAIRAHDGLALHLFLDSQKQNLNIEMEALFPLTVSFAVHASDKQPTRMHKISPGFSHYVNVDVKKYSRLKEPYQTDCISDWPPGLDRGECHFLTSVQTSKMKKSYLFLVLLKMRWRL